MQTTKICYFCEKWESGGIESVLNNIILHLDSEKFEVHIVAAYIAESVFTEPLKKRGVIFHRLSGSQRKIFENHRLFMRLLNTQRYDVVHLNIFQGLSLYYAHLARQAGVPVRIAHAHNTALRKSGTRLLKMLLHNAAKRLFTDAATVLWACSDHAARFMFSGRSLVKRGFCFIPNGIETLRFQFDAALREQVRAELGLESKFVICNIGRLCYQKNQDFLLDVFFALLRKKKNSALLLVGDGELTEPLRQKARQLGILESVHFCGASKQVERTLCASDVFAFPSRFEGFGIVAIEAQAAGLPVVCSDNVPAEARITPLVKVLPLEAGPERWADALLNCESALPREQGHIAIRQTGFDINDIVCRIEEAYRE